MTLPAPAFHGSTGGVSNKLVFVLAFDKFIVSALKAFYLFALFKKISN